jgi:hypothetical protein
VLTENKPFFTNAFLLKVKIYVNYIDINGEKQALVEHRLGSQVFLFVHVQLYFLRIDLCIIVLVWLIHKHTASSTSLASLSYADRGLHRALACPNRQLKVRSTRKPYNAFPT